MIVLLPTSIYFIFLFSLTILLSPNSWYFYQPRLQVIGSEDDFSLFSNNQYMVLSTRVYLQLGIKEPGKEVVILLLCHFILPILIGSF